VTEHKFLTQWCKMWRIIAVVLLLMLVSAWSVAAEPVTPEQVSSEHTALEHTVLKSAEDSDGDGLTDLEEARVYKTDPQFADTDTDGLADGLEVNEYWTLPLVADTDGDQFIDGIEVRFGSDPTDGSSFPTQKMPGFNDLDGDGISNSEERMLGSDAQRVDSDFDGVKDFEEIRVYFTSPILVDSDGDGAWDGEEVAAGTDPGDAHSTPPKTP